MGLHGFLPAEMAQHFSTSSPYECHDSDATILKLVNNQKNNNIKSDPPWDGWQKAGKIMVKSPWQIMPKNCSQMARWTHTSPAWANNSWTWRLGPWVNWCVQQHHHGWFGFIEFHWILRGIMVIYGNLWEFMVIIHQFNCVKYYSDITKPYCWPSYDPPMSSRICQTKRFTAALVFLPAMFSQRMGGVKLPWCHWKKTSQSSTSHDWGQTSSLKLGVCHGITILYWWFYGVGYWPAATCLCFSW